MTVLRLLCAHDRHSFQAYYEDCRSLTKSVGPQEYRYRKFDFYIAVNFLGQSNKVDHNNLPLFIKSISHEERSGIAGVIITSLAGPVQTAATPSKAPANVYRRDAGLELLLAYCSSDRQDLSIARRRRTFVL